MNKKGKVAVMGSFVVDLMMRAERLPAPGETLKGRGFYTGAGGKGSNQGVAASLAGGDTVMITKIGKDGFGRMALDSFRSFGMDTAFVLEDEEHPTGAALIMVDEHTSQNQIIVSLGACGNITASDLDAARAKIAEADIFLTQLETNQDAMLHAVDIAYDAQVPIILNPAPAEAFPESLYAKLDYFTPNETEAAFYYGSPVETEADAKAAGGFFLRKGVKNCIFTLGARGAYLFTSHGGRLFPPFKVKAIDTTGAGDAFNGGLAAALSEGRSLEEAVVFAGATAALCVTRLGTAKAMPLRAEIDALIRGGKG